MENNYVFAKLQYYESLNEYPIAIGMVLFDTSATRVKRGGVAFV